MSSTEYDANSESPLPPSGGPCLYPFKDRHKQIKVLELISDSSDASSNSEIGEGSAQAHVFKVEIGRARYALKVFKFQSVSSLRDTAFPTWNWRVDDATLLFHSDPFFAECRAYGRIDEYYRNPRQISLGAKLNVTGSVEVASKRAASKRVKSRQRARAADVEKRKISTVDSSRQIAVPCYGFIAIPAEPYQEIFRDKFGIADWNRPEWDQSRPIMSQLPLRGLVKELVEHKPAIANPPRMLRDLKKLRKIGIYQRDIAERNYLGGRLVDFGLAWTVPHWAIVAFGVHGGDLAERYKEGDLVDFDDMLAEADVKVGWRVRATRNEEMMDKLRPRRDR